MDLNDTKTEKEDRIDEESNDYVVLLMRTKSKKHKVPTDEWTDWVNCPNC